MLLSINVESIVYDLFGEGTKLRERVYELEKYKKIVEGELYHIEFDNKSSSGLTSAMKTMTYLF